MFVALLGSACGFDATGGASASASASIGSTHAQSSAGDETASATQAHGSGTHEPPGSSSAAADASSAADTATSEATTTIADATTGPIESESSSSGPPPAVCGNGIIEPGESCEGADFNGFTCSDEGFGYEGTPACNNCQLDAGPCCVQDGVPCLPGAHDCCNGCGLDFSCD